RHPRGDRPGERRHRADVELLLHPRGHRRGVRGARPPPPHERHHQRLHSTIRELSAARRAYDGPPGEGGWNVRIGVSGTHRTGKSTLVGDLAEQLPGYRVVDEPYHLLEEEGYEFSDPPTLEDWVEQLRRSIEELEGDPSPDLLLDRCPLDLLAYLKA